MEVKLDIIDNTFKNCNKCKKNYTLDNFFNTNRRCGKNIYTKNCILCRNLDKNRKRRIKIRCNICKKKLDKFNFCKFCRNEKWKTIPGFSNYKISNYGRIKNIKNNLLFSDTSKNFKKHRSYIKYTIKNDVNEQSNQLLHRLVAITFIKNKDNKPEVNHIDGNIYNNHVSNLEWCTRSHQVDHAIKKGLLKPSNKSVIQIDKNNNIVNTYESIKAAAKSVGTSPRNIGHVLHGEQKTAGGFFWKFEKESKKVNFKNSPFKWKKIKKYNYFVSKKGEVANKYGHILSSSNKNGYLSVQLYKNGKGKSKLVHRLVAKTFIKIKKSHKYQVDHINGIRNDNRVENLRWCIGSIINMRNETTLKKKRKKVTQFNMDGEVIQTFESITDAHNKTGINHITCACKGKISQSGGYIWKYVE